MKKQILSIILMIIAIAIAGGALYWKKQNSTANTGGTGQNMNQEIEASTGVTVAVNPGTDMPAATATPGPMLPESTPAPTAEPANNQTSDTADTPTTEPTTTQVPDTAGTPTTEPTTTQIPDAVGTPTTEPAHTQTSNTGSTNNASGADTGATAPKSTPFPTNTPVPTSAPTPRPAQTPATPEPTPAVQVTDAYTRDTVDSLTSIGLAPEDINSLADMGITESEITDVISVVNITPEMVAEFDKYKDIWANASNLEKKLMIELLKQVAGK